MNNFKKMILSALLAVGFGSMGGAFAVESRFMPKEKNPSDTTIGTIQMRDSDDSTWKDVLYVSTLRQQDQNVYTTSGGGVGKLSYALYGLPDRQFHPEASALIEVLGTTLTWVPATERAGGLKLGYNMVQHVSLDELDADMVGLEAIRKAIAALVAATEK